MQGPQYLFALVNKAGQSATWNGSSVVFTSFLSPLELSPAEWQSITIVTERNKSTFALDISYGVPQTYLRQVASILKSTVYSKGIEEVLYLLILEQQLWFDDATYGFYYAQIAKSEIDLSTFSDKGSVTTNTLDGDIAKYIKSKGDQVFSIDIDVPERQGIVMDGTTLQESASFIIQDPIDPAYRPNGNHTQGLSLISEDQKTSLGAQQTSRQNIDQTQHAQLFASEDFIFQSSNQTQLTVLTDYAVTVEPTPGSSIPIDPTLRLNIGFIVLDAAGAVVAYPDNSNVYYDSGPGFESAFGRHIVKITHTFTVPANCFVYPRCQANVTNDSYANGLQFTYDNNSKTSDATPNMILQYNYRFKSTVCWGLRAPILLQKVVAAMTDGQFTAKSDLLDNPDIELFFSCGDALRQLIGSQIKISLNRLLKCLNLVHGIGSGSINSQLRVERKAFWVAPGDPGVDLGVAGDGFNIEPATDMLPASIKIGWPNQDYNVALGDVNGKYEICVTQIYNTPYTRVSTVLDITCDVRADMMGAEFDRINTDGKTSTADNSDNDVFVFHCTKKSIQQLPNGVFAPITINGVFYPGPTKLLGLDRTINAFVVDNNQYIKAGDTYLVGAIPYIATTSQYLHVGLIDKTTAFNVALSPKQCLIRSHGDYIHSLCYKMDDKFLTFSKSDKNSELLINNPNGVSTEENGDVSIGSLKAVLFQPFYVTVPISAPPSLALDLVSNPVRRYNTIYRNIALVGTAMKTAIAPTDGAEQAYQLLLDASVDLTQFNTIYE